MVKGIKMNPSQQIPTQLQRPKFRFYLCGDKGDWVKRAIEKEWTTTNNYSHDNPKLLNHKGNYGIVCGVGSLVVLDFDNRQYYNEVKHLLPETFTVLSAGKKLPHLYYIYNGEMIKKLSVRGKDNKTLLDIQASGSGVVAPNSINGKSFYTIVRDLPLAYLTQANIMDIFKVVPKKSNSLLSKQIRNYSTVENPQEIENSIKILLHHGIERRSNTLFKCPFHDSVGGSNLNVIPDGGIYCFHEQKYWHKVHNFIDDYLRWKNRN